MNLYAVPVRINVDAGRFLEWLAAVDAAIAYIALGPFAIDQWETDGGAGHPDLELQ